MCRCVSTKRMEKAPNCGTASLDISPPYGSCIRLCCLCQTCKLVFPSRGPARRIAPIWTLSTQATPACSPQGRGTSATPLWTFSPVFEAIKQCRHDPGAVYSALAPKLMWLSHLKLEMSALHVFRIFFLLDGWIILRVIELMWTFLCKFIRVPRSQTLLPKYDVESDFFWFH